MKGINMRRILITHSVSAVAHKYANAYLKKHKQAVIDELNALKQTIDQDKCNNWRTFSHYVEEIRNNLHQIILLHPQKFLEFQEKHLKLNSTLPSFDSTQWSNAPNNPKFYDALVTILRYKDVRTNILPPILCELDINTCIYCNATYIPTVDIGNNKKARYELDHFFPKSDYPFLSVSFFNLQPGCPICNRWKLTQKSNFNLYTDDATKLNPFQFQLTMSSLLNYHQTTTSSCLKLKLKSSEYNDLVDIQRTNLAINHNFVFKIDNLYKKFDSEVEEMVWKYFTMNQSFFDQFKASFIKEFPSLSYKDIYRFIYGFFGDEEDIHLRPLTKMKQDLAKQLKFIDKESKK